MALAFAGSCLSGYILTNKTRGHKLAAAAWNGVARPTAWRDLQRGATDSVAAQPTADICVHFVTFSRQMRRA